MKRLSLAVALVLWAALPALAQVQGGSITGTVNVRNAPSTSRGAIIGHKSKGAVVRSPLYKDDFSNNGFAEVLLGNGNIGWISSAYVD